MGGAKAVTEIRSGLAMGGDRGILVYSMRRIS
jgi:hypothetical protein